MQLVIVEGCAWQQDWKTFDDCCCNYNEAGPMTAACLLGTALLLKRSCSGAVGCKDAAAALVAMCQRLGESGGDQSQLATNAAG